MRPLQVVESLRKLLASQRPVYLWGPPGVGKSSLIHQAAAAENFEVRDIRAVLLDPVDLRGIPRIDKAGSAQWCPPSFLPKGGTGVLFLDELAQAPPLVQAACLQLTLDRRVGEYVLPEGWSIVAASNRQEDRAGTHRLISPLLNRFIHLDLEVSKDDWQQWALASGIQPEVRSFLNFRPGLLFNFDPSAGARSFPTPRSWSFVSDVLPLVDVPELLHPVVAGCVGEGPAAEFTAFTRTYRDLPDVDQLLKSPQSASVPKDPAILYALSGSIVERCRKAEAPLLNNAVVYSGRMPTEFGVLTMRDAAAVNAQILRQPAASGWLGKHKDILLGDGR